MSEKQKIARLQRAYTVGEQHKTHHNRSAILQNEEDFVCGGDLG